MRNTIFALATSALLLGGVVVGCGGGGKTTIKTDGGTDMAKKTDGGGGGDLSSPMLACSEYVDCQNACYVAAGTSGDPTSCLMTCDAEAKPTVHNSTKFDGLFDKAALCYQLYCVGKDFDMPYKCGINFTTNQFTEVNGDKITSNTGVCSTCLNDASALLYGGTCTDATSKDCSLSSNSMATAVCGAAINACITNK